MTKVLYPGSFDPITKGHMNIIEQASNLFDEVIIAILQNPNKKSMFTQKERLEMISGLYKQYENIKVITGSGAAVDIAALHECNRKYGCLSESYRKTHYGGAALYGNGKYYDGRRKSRR